MELSAFSQNVEYVMSPNLDNYTCQFKLMSPKFEIMGKHLICSGRNLTCRSAV